MARCYDYAECFQEAPIGSLWCDHCRARRAKLAEERGAVAVAAAQATIARINAEDAARVTVECEGGCGRWVPNARQQQANQVEAIRRRMKKQLMTGRVQIDSGQPLGSFDAYCRAIELTAPHRLQQARNLCDDCLQAKMQDAVIFLGDSPSAPAAPPMKGEEHGEQEQASWDGQDE